MSKVALVFPYFRTRAATTKTHGRTGWRALIPQLVLIAVLLAINIYMFSQPMAHRA